MNPPPRTSTMSEFDERLAVEMTRGYLRAMDTFA